MTKQPRRAGSPTDDLFAAFDVALFEHHATGVFTPIGKIPEWLPTAGNLTDDFPLLDLFLSELEANWAGQSDIWTETSAGGNELYLQAIAATLGGRHFVAIRSMPPALFTYQQLAHDFELAKEKIEKLNIELARATQAKSDFLATMSHEIRTPLNAIIGMADVLSASSLTPDQQKSVDVFQRNGVGLLTLINDILDLSKVESGRIDLESIAFDLRDVVARAMEVVEGRVNAKGLALHRSIAPDVPNYLIGDPNRLRQIIINLLGNSIKFTETGGLEVEVTLEKRGAGTPARSVGTPAHASNKALFLLFAIRDTGIGIPADKLSSIFESFTQVDASTTRKYGGTGLGLTISKRLVELMGGCIWVESTLGVGSTFYFTAAFGIQESPTETLQPKATVEDLESRLAGARILLADDSDDNRYLIQSYLKRTQTVIDIAENGAIAVEKAKASRYDVILMDVEMPVMDGAEATAEIRKHDTSTPILALTAHAFAEMTARSLEAGFTAVLTKPIRKVTLLESLTTHAPRNTGDPVAGGFTQRGALPRVFIPIEPGLEDVVPSYLEKRRADVATYRAALAVSDFDSIKKLAHKMKGTGAGYGFQALTDLGSTLERAAIDGNGPQVSQSLDDLALYLDSIELQYSQGQRRI